MRRVLTTVAVAVAVVVTTVAAVALTADPTGMLSPIAPELSQADIAMVNLETAITDRGTPDPEEFNFRTPARALDALRSAGIDVATQANDHGRDYGPLGLADTLAAIRATRFPVVGIGANATEAYTPWRTEVRGQRVAVLGATDVLDDPLEAGWTATETQPGVASAKGAGRLGAASVAHGLAFYNESGPSGVSGVLKVTATGRDIGLYAWKPARIQGGIPRLLAGPTAERGLGAWSAARGCTGLAT